MKNAMRIFLAILCLLCLALFTSCERAQTPNAKTNTNAAAKTSVLFIKSFICIVIDC